MSARRRLAALLLAGAGLGGAAEAATGPPSASRLLTRTISVHGQEPVTRITLHVAPDGRGGEVVARDGWFEPDPAWVRTWPIPR